MRTVTEPCRKSGSAMQRMIRRGLIICSAQASESHNAWLDPVSSPTQGVQHDLRWAEKSDRHTARTGACRSVALHGFVLPGTMDHAPWAACIGENGEAAGQADLSAMGMPTQHQVVIDGGCSPIGFGRAGQQDADGVAGDRWRK